MEIPSGPSEENKEDENMEELDKTYVKLSHDDAPGKKESWIKEYIIYVVQFYHWFNFFFFFCFQTHYHTLPYPKTKEKKI